jgi:hypothetical protein
MTNMGKEETESKLRAAEEKIKLLKTEFGTAATREMTERARMESKLQTAMEKINSLKTERGAALLREETANMEKAKMESKMKAAMEQIRSLRNERGAAESEWETSYLERARIESKLQAALQQIQSLGTQLEAATSRCLNSNVERAKMGLKLRDAVKFIEYLKAKLKEVRPRQGTPNGAPRQDTPNVAQRQDRHKTDSFNGQHRRCNFDGNSSRTTEDIQIIQDKQIQFLKTELKAEVRRQDTPNGAQRQARNKTDTFNGQDRRDSCGGNLETSTVIPKIQGMRAHLNEAVEKVHQGETLTPEVKDIENDLRKYKIQKNDICHNNRVTNGLEKESLAIEQAVNTLLPRDLVVRTEEKRNNIKGQLARDDGNEDSVMVERKECRNRMLTNVKKRQEREEMQEEGDIMPNKKIRT